MRFLNSNIITDITSMKYHEKINKIIKILKHKFNKIF